LSKEFSHYKNGAGIKKEISLSNLRKTYLTWHHQVLGCPSSKQCRLLVVENFVI